MASVCTPELLYVWAVHRERAVRGFLDLRSLPESIPAGAAYSRSTSVPDCRSARLRSYNLAPL